MDETDAGGYLSGLNQKVAMSTLDSLLVVPFREVRHFQPDDCLHYEPMEIRGRMHRWTIPAHHHEALHQFEMLERGSVVARFDDRSERLVAPAAWMVSPGTIHGFAYEPSSAGHVVTIPTPMLQRFLAPLPDIEYRLKHPIIVRSNAGQDIDELRGLFAMLAQEFQGRQPGRAEALQAHAVLLGLWFTRRHVATVGGAQHRPGGDALVQRFRKHLERRYRAHWTVRDYAGALAVTPDHLSRRCRAVTGLSALDLVHERLMLEARRLLAYSSVPVSEIAHQLGFDDPAYFSRLFAKRCGQSPSAYRRSVLDGLAVLASGNERR
jgi:AraC-like DNA-binding protein